MELYIDGIRVPMFSESGVDIVDTIQNVKDIKKVFTAFSQQFSIPASKEVNRIFRHYYDFNIQNGFDARFKIDGAIKLHGADFRKGKIRLNGTTLKDGSPYAYKIVFFGETVELSDLLGEDELSALEFNFLNHTYDISTVRNGFETGLTDNGVTSADRKIIYPFISHSKQFQITGGQFQEFNNASGNLSYVDLKPAIKLNEIIKAIESKYSLDFSNDFFSSDIFLNMFLWLHREKGFVTSGNESQSFVLDIDDWTPSGSGADLRPMTSYESGTGLDEESQKYRFKATVTPLTTALSGLYDIKMTDALTGQVVGEWTNQSGTQTFTSQFLSSTASREWQIRTEIFTEGQLQTFQLDAEIIQYFQFWDTDFGESWLEEVTTSKTYDSPNATETMVGEIIVSQQVPKMKIIDFLTGIFKMFNLTAYKEDSGEIKTLPLDEYYDAGNTYDISRYIDYSKKVSVDRVLPFRAVKFSFSEPKTFLAVKRLELTNQEFGSLEYTGGDAFDGEKYDIKIPFEKMLFERIQDEDTGAPSPVAYGWFVDDKQDATLGAPLVFVNYPNKSTGSGNKRIKWSDGVFTDSYNAPSNSLEDDSQTINFNAEIDEIDLVLNENSLFQTYYNRYISNLYNIQARKMTFDAYFPEWLILQYRLNDVFIINNRQYRINSVKVNPVTRKARLELINRLDETNTEESSVQSVPTPQELTFNSANSSEIIVDWIDVPSSRIVGYNVYLDGVFDQLVNTGIQTATIKSLSPSTSYEIWVLPVDDLGNESQLQQDRTVITASTTA